VCAVAFACYFCSEFVHLSRLHEKVQIPLYLANSSSQVASKTTFCTLCQLLPTSVCAFFQFIPLYIVYKMNLSDCVNPYHRIPEAVKKTCTWTVWIVYTRYLCWWFVEVWWSSVETLKSNFLDNRWPKRKNRFLVDYCFSHCTIPPHCDSDSHLNAASFDPVRMRDRPPCPPHASTSPFFADRLCLLLPGRSRRSTKSDRRDGLI